MLLQSAINEYLLIQRIRGNSDKTVQFYDVVLELFSDFCRGIQINEIQLKNLQDYYLSLLDRELTSITIQTYIRALRAFLNWCYGEGYIKVKLTDKFKLPKAGEKVIDILSDYEINLLFGSFDVKSILGLRDYCICALMLDCGLRKNEVVLQTFSRYRGLDGYIIAQGKGNRQRFVPMGLDTRQHILKYVTLIQNQVDDILFRKNDGSPITDSTVKQLFYRLKDITGIKRLKPHLLRHTFATKFVENGGNVFTLQQILGHTTLEMSKKYMHFGVGSKIEKYRMFSPLDNAKKPSKPRL